MRQKNSPTNGSQTKKGRQMKEGVLTEFVCMFRADSKHNSVHEGSGPPQLRLIDKLCSTSPALTLAPRQRLRAVLHKML